MNIPDFDKVIHERARLRILAMLAANEDGCVSFVSLRDRLGMTAGNLSSQLSVLESHGYIETKKYFRGRKPSTDIVLTQEGREALQEYLSALERLITELKYQV